MQNIKLILFPSFVGGLLEEKTIAPSDLNDIEKLSTILSELSVNKILYLNEYHGDDAVPVTETRPMDKALNVFRLDIFKAYVANNEFGVGYKSNVPVYSVGSTLNALTDVGNENMTPSLEKMLHLYHLGFTVYRIEPKIYGVVFQPLCEVDSPYVRLGKHLKDMEGLLSDLSLELNDKELIDEDIYQYYLDLI